MVHQDPLGPKVHQVPLVPESVNWGAWVFWRLEDWELETLILKNLGVSEKSRLINEVVLLNGIRLISGIRYTVVVKVIY